MLRKEKILAGDLKKILTDYDLGEIIEVNPIPSSGNIAYLIKAEKGNFFLRICPSGPRYRSREEIASEIELLEYLSQNKFPVPVPYKKKNGQIIVFYKGKYGYLREYDDGEPFLNPNLDQIEQFGKILGQFHSLTAGFKTKNRRLHIFNSEETKKHFALNKKKIVHSKFKNATEFVSKVEKELDSMDFAQDLPSGMIHEDLGKRHVLWNKGKVASLIDFDRTYYGPLILDLGQALRGWCFVNNWTAWSNQNVRALLKGYQSKRKLTGTEKQFLFDAIKFGVLERSISFFLRFIEVTQDPKDAKFAYESAFDFLHMLEDNRDEFERIIGL